MILDEVRALQKSIRHDPDVQDIKADLLASLAFVHEAIASRKTFRVDPGLDERARQAKLQGDAGDRWLRMVAE